MQGWEGRSGAWRPTTEQVDVGWAGENNAEGSWPAGSEVATLLQKSPSCHSHLSEVKNSLELNFQHRQR